MQLGPQVGELEPVLLQLGQQLELLQLGQQLELLQLVLLRSHQIERSLQVRRRQQLSDLRQQQFLRVPLLLAMESRYRLYL
jgi:hypothetical protein